MGKAALIVWLLLPIAVVTALWFSIDKDQARPHPNPDANIIGGGTPTDKPIDTPVKEPAPSTPQVIDPPPADEPAEAWSVEPIEEHINDAHNTEAQPPTRQLSEGRLERLRPAPGSDLIQRVPEAAAGVTIWLPPGYVESAQQPRDYTVLYMIGGEELFGTMGGAGTAGTGEDTGPDDWQLDVQLGLLIRERTLPNVLVVAVPPCQSADACAALIEAVMPVVRKYAISRDVSKTLIGGGGEIGGRRALQVATRMASSFGGVMAQSPALYDEHREFMHELLNMKEWPPRVYVSVGEFDMGRGDGTDRDIYAGLNHQNQSMLQGLAELLNGRNVGPENRRLEFEAGVRAEPRAWGKRTPDALAFLLKSDKPASGE